MCYKSPSKDINDFTAKHAVILKQNERKNFSFRPRCCGTSGQSLHQELWTSCIDVTRCSARWYRGQPAHQPPCSSPVPCTTDHTTSVSELEFNVPFQHKYGYIRDEWSQFIEDTVEPSVFLPGIISLVTMCIEIIWNNSFLVGGRARAEARIDPRPLRTSRSTAHGAQVVWPLDYMGRAHITSSTPPPQHCNGCFLVYPVPP